MNFLRRIQTRRVPVAILHTAAWLVPTVQRREWLAEWKAELWHVCDSCAGKQEGCPDDMQQATMFCLGAFKDAFWLRRENPASTFSEIFQMGSPSRCIALLVGLAATHRVARWLSTRRSESDSSIAIFQSAKPGFDFAQRAHGRSVTFHPS